MNVISRIAHIENLYWAWNKARNAFRPGDVWYDEIEIAGFESNLHENLLQISREIISGKYKLQPLRPAAFPKSQSKDGEPRTRQTFWVSIKDQVTWLAVVNIIGSDLDYKMPFWSFGNRLYLSVWYEQIDENSKEIKFGWYRNTRGLIYRKWTQSWPLFRRAISITSKIIAYRDKFLENSEKFVKNELSENGEIDTFNYNEAYPSHLQIKYFIKEYWNRKLSNEVYWCGIDLEKFYPNINIDVVLENIFNHLPNNKKSIELENLIKKLLAFKIDIEGWTRKELKQIDINYRGKYRSKTIQYKGMPTGLLIAGFLANVALLKVDDDVNRELNKRKNIAHFRFVDDHVILSDSFDELIDWLKFYESLLKNNNSGARFNPDKVEPESLQTYYSKLMRKVKNIQSFKAKASKECNIDPKFPTPLMTQTLAKVSLITQMDFELMDESEEDQVIADLEHLLIADIPDHELRRDTRVSFAASILARIIPNKSIDLSKLYEAHTNSSQLREKIKNKQKDKKENVEHFKHELSDIKNQIKELKLEVKNKKQTIEQHVFQLLLHAVKENFEKVRLWPRIVEYCYNTGYDGLEEILDVIKLLRKENKTTKLSSEFILSLYVQSITNYALKAAYSLSYESLSYAEKTKRKTFLNSILLISFLRGIENQVDTKSKYYWICSLDLLIFSVYNILILEDDLGIRYYDNMNSYLKEKGLTQSSSSLSEWVHDSHEINEYIYWMVQKTIPKTALQPNRIWTKNISSLSFKYKLPALLLMFPQNIPDDFIKENDAVFSKALKKINQGWVFDFLKNKRAEPNLLGLLKIKEDNKPLSNFSSNKKEYCTLYEWVEWIKNETHHKKDFPQNIFDPRKSEWTALHIIEGIAVELQKNLFNLSDPDNLLYNSDSHYLNIHPSNYLIHNKWKKKQSIVSWQEWFYIAKIEILLREKKEFINDTRYVNKEYIKQLENKQISIIQGLTMLMIGILRQDFEFPHIFNLEGRSTNNSYLFIKLLNGFGISSITESIIDSAFSSRNRESKYWIPENKIDEFDHADDTLNDPPGIYSISDYIKYIRLSKKILEKYQVTAYNHLPRQLIPINLIQLTNKQPIASILKDENFEEIIDLI